VTKCYIHPFYDGSQPTHALCDNCKEIRREYLLFTVPPTQPSLGTNPKDIVGDTKPPLHLVPPPALVRLAKVMELGAKKYGPYNWREKKVQYHAYVAAALRHLYSAFDGEDDDPESSQGHLEHAMACCAILIDARETGNLIDNRPVKGVTGKLIAELSKKEKKNGE
jgi:dATP/dGTP diphosphohydrolase